MEWGFHKSKDMELNDNHSGKKASYETWYHEGWKFRAIIGFVSSPEGDCLNEMEQEFLNRVDAHLATAGLPTRNR